MKRLKFVICCCLAMTSSAAYATCQQPLGLYNGAASGLWYWSGTAVSVHDLAYVANFSTGPTGLQGTLTTLGRTEPTSGATTPVVIEAQYTFPASGTTVKWYPSYCAGELVLSNITVNPAPDAPLTATYAFTVNNSGKTITLTYLSGTYANGILDYYVKSFPIQLTQP
ncbi:MAG: hypothetical protein WAK03_17545 [Methylocystis sp.]|jgi:hypothetical protein